MLQAGPSQALSQPLVLLRLRRQRFKKYNKISESIFAGHKPPTVIIRPVLYYRKLKYQEKAVL